MDLNKEAEEKYREFPNNPKDKPECGYNRDVNCFRKRKAFVAGANSKYVKAKIIQAKIETIEMVINCYNLLHEDVDDLKLTINRLKEQLRQVENE